MYKRRQEAEVLFLTFKLSKCPSLYAFGYISRKIISLHLRPSMVLNYKIRILIY